MQRVKVEDGAIDGLFSEGDPANGGPFPTKVRAYSLNGFQEEIANAIEKSDIELDGSSLDQLFFAIKKNSKYQTIVEKPENLRSAIENAKDGEAIHVRSMRYVLDGSPIQLSANSVELDLSPGTEIIGRLADEDSGGLTEVGSGILEVTGHNCLIRGGVWSFDGNADGKYHAVKSSLEVKHRPYFGMCRVVDDLIEPSATTIPFSSVIRF